MVPRLCVGTIIGRSASTPGIVCAVKNRSHAGMGAINEYGIPQERGYGGCTRSGWTRVDRLEEMMMQVAYEHTKTEMSLRDLKREMSNFKREMQDFKDEMRVFKDGVNEFKQEIRASKKENDRRLGDLANKMGTLVEDVVAPCLPRKKFMIVFRSWI
ncbi:MAG: hypothetical protein R6V55_09475 [Desulfovermiculus sp.]